MADMRDRLIELIGSKVCDYYSPTCDEWEPHSCAKCYANDCRIGELADHLLANGVILPPCKVGDTVYQIYYNTSACRECDCYSSFCGMDEICDKHYELYPELYDEDDEERCPKHYLEVIESKPILEWIVCRMRDFGKTVFLTREAAEKALREKEKS